MNWYGVVNVLPNLFHTYGIRTVRTEYGVWSVGHFILHHSTHPCMDRKPEQCLLSVDKLCCDGQRRQFVTLCYIAAPSSTPAGESHVH